MAIFDISYVGEMPYLKLTGGIVTGATTFNDNLAVSTINGVTVGSDPKFTDTTYSVATTSANGLLSSTDKTAVNKIGTGTLNTTSQTLIGAVNELNGKIRGNICTTNNLPVFTNSSASTITSAYYIDYTATESCFVYFVVRYTPVSGYSSGVPVLSTQHPYRGKYGYSIGSSYSNLWYSDGKDVITLSFKAVGATTYGDATETAYLYAWPFILRAGETMRYWIYSTDVRIISGSKVNVDRYVLPFSFT